VEKRETEDRSEFPDRGVTVFTGINGFFDDGRVDNARARAAVKEADLIIGRDLGDGHTFLLYGKDLLQRIVANGETQEVKSVGIDLDMNTEELEAAIAMVEVLKGHNDYPS
jgi:hypothetical protein